MDSPSDDWSPGGCKAIAENEHSKSTGDSFRPWGSDVARRLWSRPSRIVSFVFAASLLLTVQAPAAEQSVDLETELGTAVFDELRDAGQVIAASPLYDELAPITVPIIRAAQPRYDHPFKFILVHEAKPNAFSVPGGNVYVMDSLLYFVKNTEELAGTLCHEVSHTIHHHSMARIADAQKTLARQLGAAILLGPDLSELILIRAIGDLHSAAYSREMESEADFTGSDLCAAAGYNPWGLIWLFQDFENADPKHLPQLLQDHPSNPARIRALEAHFRENPAIFSKFNSDRRSATPLRVAQDAPMQFLQRSENSDAQPPK